MFKAVINVLKQQKRVLLLKHIQALPGIYSTHIIQGISLLTKYLNYVTPYTTDWYQYLILFGGINRLRRSQNSPCCYRCEFGRFIIATFISFYVFVVIRISLFAILSRFCRSIWGIAGPFSTVLYLLGPLYIYLLYSRPLYMLLSKPIASGFLFVITFSKFTCIFGYSPLNSLSLNLPQCWSLPVVIRIE